MLSIGVEDIGRCCFSPRNVIRFVFQVELYHMMDLAMPEMELQGQTC